ncbi:NHL repeat-containing protein [Bryocella elongata]|uniref:NHL repeat-containing protein n=1 Tax=Bryocella elongata TaxID=863522 RepID=A0A1H5UJR5_9BACT|nr:Ig-like domain repeat protein [Bryocella elongata]SEF74497.1 NHL repeat-containing protein [Bryocella elongata]
MAVSWLRRVRGHRWLCCLLTMVCAVARSSCAQSTAMPLRPAAVAYDAAGNAYFADTDRNQVYESTLGGTLLVVAGNGSQGFAGDGGPATSAALNAPQGVAIGPAGEMYIADTGNQRIRVVQLGTISTFAGNGVRGFAGDGGSAIAASLALPTALALDSKGALLVCDTGNQRVRRISNGIVATVAGNGTQGFAGDGASATGAELDGPQGVATSIDGRIFIADSRNHRIRVIDGNGNITTLAGTGARGYSGDGSAATAAQLNLPRGLVLTSSGVLVFADSDNRRIRAISPDGVITTLIGSGTQGASVEGTTSLSAWLNAPRAVALSSLGEVTFADTANRSIQLQAQTQVQTQASDGVFTAAALVPARTSTVALTGPQSAVYGQWSGQVSVSGGASTPLGAVSLSEAGITLSTGSLTPGSANFDLTGLSVGRHALIASYAGDVVNPAASSSLQTVNITTAALLATANAVSMLYGEPVPLLGGTLTGVLAQDSGNVAVSFGTMATTLSPVGSYPITASLSGSAAANYTVSLSPSSGTLTVAQAPSFTNLPAQASGSYAGEPFVLHAIVGSTTSGTPTGTVSFLDAGATVAQAALVAGIASASYATATAGTHTFTASYSGDSNFLGSTSAAQSIVISAVPDFTVSSAGATLQTVPAGSSATYSLLVGAQPAPFSGVVAMSITGLPTGAVATFSPPAIVPGASNVGVTLTITTPVHAELVRPHPLPAPLYATALAPLLLFRRRRARLPLLGFALACLVSVLVASLGGCGARTVAPATSSSTSATYTLIVTGTGTNVAGQVITHSLPLTLVVD